ncbi:hypothetical protein EJV46_03115 [Roseococcus sp. SYP-B2431]|uniref:hypothetical protein n=1 Tax=Roseococcus sp. SYP-B2431 TaxID=2496640 RepID=UPI00103FEEAD|nr:hypothetical protein [Roseococcus sp. SYP-B2431]TCH99680.1 hypothetical protein EJV46_03115 [Roseococcus sp. SYP-B2431]
MKGITRCQARGYNPHVFMDMRDRHGTVTAINRLLLEGEIQSGFRKLYSMNMLEWTIEAAALRFPDLFKAGSREAAQFRLDQANGRNGMPKGPRGENLIRRRYPRPRASPLPRSRTTRLRALPACRIGSGPWMNWWR